MIRGKLNHNGKSLTITDEGLAEMKSLLKQGIIYIPERWTAIKCREGFNSVLGNTSDWFATRWSGYIPFHPFCLFLEASEDLHLIPVPGGFDEFSSEAAFSIFFCFFNCLFQSLPVIYSLPDLLQYRVVQVRYMPLPKRFFAASARVVPVFLTICAGLMPISWLYLNCFACAGWSHLSSSACSCNISAYIYYFTVKVAGSSPCSWVSDRAERRNPSYLHRG